MGDLSADRRYCIYCGDEIPNPSAYCPGCGEDQEPETTYAPKEEPEDEPESESSVTTSDGAELTLSDIEGTRAASIADAVYWAVSVCIYLTFAGTALVGLYGMYRVLVGPSAFGTIFPLVILGILLLSALGVVNMLLMKISPTYRLLTEMER